MGLLELRNHLLNCRLDLGVRPELPESNDVFV